MGSQDQHQQKEPQTAADALERAAELRVQADADDREAGHYTSQELRNEIRSLKQQAKALARQERREKSRADAVKIDAIIQARRDARGL